MKLLRLMCPQESLSKLMFQLIYWLARQIDMCLDKVTRNCNVGRAAVKCSYTDLASLLDKPRQLDRELLRIVLSAREASANLSRFAMCVDKANVGGMTLHNGVIGMGANVLTMVCPQARRDSKIMACPTLPVSTLPIVSLYTLPLYTLPAHNFTPHGIGRSTKLFKPWRRGLVYLLFAYVNYR